MNRAIAPIDALPADARMLVDSTLNLLGIYMTGTTEIEMMVGRNIKATLKISGGPITRDVIEDTMAHLAFYKKYFPKADEPSAELDSPQKIIDTLKAAWAEHRAELEQRAA